MRIKVNNYINEYNMLQDVDVVVAGVSGGADSVCLLFLLCEILKKEGKELRVVHVNHMIRKEASEDASFVKNLCEEFSRRFDMKIDFHLVEADVRELSKNNKLSEEEAGRIVRYDAFNKVLGNSRGVIAVAHNANDRAETMLFNEFRGSGLKGLSGIQPVSNNIIRPLLLVTRDEIEGFLKKEDLSFVTDETNLHDDYTRNKIRHNVLDYVKENVQSQVIENMNRVADQVLLAEDYIFKSTVDAAMRCTINKEEGMLVLDIEKLLEEHMYIRSRVIYDAVCFIGKKKKDITNEHVNAIMRLLESDGTKWITLIYGIHVRKEYGKLFILDKDIENNKENTIEENNISMDILEDFNPLSIPQDNYTKWFDYDKISSAVVLRTRQPGDYIIINKEMQKKSLKDYMINEKIPKDKRDSILLLADGSHIMWIIGGRISEYYKVSKNTKRVLEVRYGRED